MLSLFNFSSIFPGQSADPNDPPPNQNPVDIPAKQLCLADLVHGINH